MNISLLQKYFFTIVAVCFCNIIFAQHINQKNYPQQYFQWPVGAKKGLAANFGELRPNHYHMGLDCRTDQKENIPVYAAADGYIAKVKIESFGFGRCIYINHPNGLTTLYAHLNTFEPALENYVTIQQYLLKHWSVYLDIPASLFPIKKGDRIAASGNTGGSQGPHTHFEIRNTKSDKNLNPLLFNFDIEDNIPPEIIRLAVYDREISTYDQSPRFYPLKKINGVYIPVTGSIIAPSNKISFAITAYDRYTGSTNQNGIYGAAIFCDDKRVSGFEMDSISYDETRYLNAHIDYKLHSNGGPYVQYLSPLPGYKNGIYTTDKNAGIILMNDTSHQIKITVADANGNISTLKFLLQANKNMRSQHVDDSTQKLIPNYINIFERSTIKFYLPENALYDTINFIYKEIPSATGKLIYQLNNATIPVHTNFTINIKENFEAADTGKIVMKRFYGSKQDYKKAKYNNGFYSASFREFGYFQLLADDEAPVVTPIGFSNGMNVAKLNRIVFSVKDNCEDLEDFTALLDGNWLRFTNDKGKNFIYIFDEHCPAGTHELKITATDLAGNKTEKLYHFSR